MGCHVLLQCVEWKGRVAPLGMNIALRCWDQTVLAASFLFAVLLVLLLFLEMKLQLCPAFLFLAIWGAVGYDKGEIGTPTKEVLLCGTDLSK